MSRWNFFDPDDLGAFDLDFKPESAIIPEIQMAGFSGLLDSQSRPVLAFAMCGRFLSQWHARVGLEIHVAADLEMSAGIVAWITELWENNSTYETEFGAEVLRQRERIREAGNG